MTPKDKRALPIFPLPNGVLFPETLLPLHIFEPRYRDMVADVLEDDRLIGIQLLDPDAEAKPGEPPAVFEIGCAGEIVEHDELEDGRSNIVLKGAFRYRIGAEIEGMSYRRAVVTPHPIEPLDEGMEPDRKTWRRLLVRAVGRLADSVGRPEARDLSTSLSDEGLVNEALSRLGLSTSDRYQLLAMSRLNERYEWLLAHIGSLQERLDLLAPFRRDGTDPRWN